jgi:hypothetical protein
MGMELVRQDPQMYMSPDEVMAMFNDGAVDVASLFPPEFPPQQQPQQQELRGRSGAEGVQWVFVS